PEGVGRVELHVKDEDAVAELRDRNPLLRGELEEVRGARLAELLVEFVAGHEDALVGRHRMRKALKALGNGRPERFPPLLPADERRVERLRAEVRDRAGGVEGAVR